MSDEYEFSVDWFSPHWHNWLIATRNLKVQKILEIGSFEGRSTCKMIEEFGSKSPLSIFCVDTWGGGLEHSKFNMGCVESRFDHNISLAQRRANHPITIQKCKGMSADQLVHLLGSGHASSFDIIFIDGSHQALDVITDLVLAYRLCRVDGLIICDDYLWSMESHGAQDVLTMPKIAVDAFSTIFMRQVKQMTLSLYQVYFIKTG